MNDEKNILKNSNLLAFAKKGGITVFEILKNTIPFFSIENKWKFYYLSRVIPDIFLNIV